MLSINPQKLCDYSVKRSEMSIKGDDHILSAAYKSRRLELCMTLDAATTDICSKACACKFENNQQPMDSKIGRPLFERVDLNYDRIAKISKSNNLEKGVRLFLYNRFDQIENLIEKYGVDCFIASNEILELLVNLVDGNYERCEELIANIDRVRSALSEYEFFTFGICLSEYFIRTNQFIKAKSFVKKFRYEATCKELKQLYLEQIFVVYFNLDDKTEAFNAYRLLEKEFNNGYPKKREIVDKIHYLELFSSKATLIELRNMLDDIIPEEYIEEYWYSYCLCLIKNKEYNECMQLIQKYSLTSSRFVALYVYSVNMLSWPVIIDKTKDNLERKIPQKIINKINEFVERMEKNHYNVIDCNFIKLMQLELVGTSYEELVAYIREIALKYDKSYQHRFYSRIYTKHLFTYLGIMTRYKEAFLIVKGEQALN